MRILIAPIEISGFYRALNSGFREIGVESTFAELWPHPYQYENDKADKTWPISWARSLARRTRAAPRGSPQRAFWLVPGAAVRAIVFLWAIARFDVFVFPFGTTILHVPWLELPVLSLFRKKIIFHFHGSDSRPPYMDGYLGEVDRSGKPHDFKELARVVKRRVALIDRYADVVVDNPLSAHFHTRECVNGFAIGIPSLARPVPPAPQRSGRGSASVRILHAPSHAEAKGTPHIREAIAALRARGLDLDYVELIGQSNETVITELESCDFVIDQLYSDTPLAGFGVEAARAGKPAIVGGYASEEFRRWIPPTLMAPSHYCKPSELLAAIERLSTDRSYREELGKRAKGFFDLRSKPAEVAARYVKLIRGEAPADWRFDPHGITYLRGCGLSEERARARIRDMVNADGAEALQLEDKPAIARALIDFAESDGA